MIPTTDILVTVASPGELIPTAYVSNYSDNTVTPVDTRTGTAGPPIAVGSGPGRRGGHAGRQRLFVANNNTNNVTVIDTTTNHGDRHRRGRERSRPTSPRPRTARRSG